MSNNDIFVYFISGFAGALALFWMSEIITNPDSKTSIAKKLAHSILFSGLCVLSIPVYNLSLVLGRVVFIALNLVWLRCFLKINWSNTVLTYALATIIIMLTTYTASFVVLLLPDLDTTLYTIAYFVAIPLTAMLPVSDVYDFFANRVKRGYAVALVVIVGLVLIYSTFVTMGNGGDVKVSALLTSVVAIMVFAFYKVADQLESFKKFQTAPEEKKKVAIGVLDEKKDKKVSWIRDFLNL